MSTGEQKAADATQLISQLKDESNPAYDAFMSKHRFDTTLKMPREEDKQNLLLGIKGMFSADPRCKELGAKKLRPKYVFPKRTSAEAKIYLALMATPETQGIFLKFMSSLFDEAYYQDKKEFILMLKTGKPAFEQMLADPRNELYVPAIKKVSRAIASYDRSLTIQPAEFKKIEDAFGVMLGKEVSDFDHTTEYLHYVYHEHLAAEFSGYLHPEGIKSLGKQSPLFRFDGDSYYHLPRHFDFDDSLFDMHGLIDGIKSEPKSEIERLSRSFQDSLYIRGHDLGRVIVEYGLDLRRTTSLYVIGRIKTDGTLNDALCTTLLHVNRDMLEYGSEIRVSKRGNEILKGIKGKLKKLFRVMLVTEECARDTGYCFHGQECLAEEFEVLLQDPRNSLVSCWGMTESIYAFAILQRIPHA
ncbi:MAG: hypothetical protein JRH20_28595 [Deltaproteobacteria bacterium]|nr:hypothetical protein [Deltaproteobacteria bacterium]